MQIIRFLSKVVGTVTLSCHSFCESRGQVVAHRAKGSDSSQTLRAYIASTMPLSTTLRAFHLPQMRHNRVMDPKLWSQFRHPSKNHFFQGNFEIRLRAFHPRYLSTSNNPPFKPWQFEVVESNGDYRKETFLEDYIGGPLYENQKNLPRLPIPSIEDTLKRFLPTALPLVKSEQEKTALLAACEAFPKQAKVLHERLIDRRENEMRDSSWLQLWWNQLGYLQYRESVMINVSYFFQFHDDHTTDLDEGNTNLQRAAAMLFATAEFRKRVCSGTLPADKIGKKQTPLCSTPYKYMFNACRIPQPQQDSYRIYDPSRFTHAIVARNGHFFSIEMVHPGTGDPLPVDQLEKQLRRCVELADSKPQGFLGLLTSSNRDTWTHARNRLIEKGGPPMEQALKVIESGAVLVGLDDTTPNSREESCVKLLTGGKASGSNRWFDKSIQLLVARNGKSGILGEHSMMDGMVLVNLSDHITKTTYADVKDRSIDSTHGPTEVKDIFAGILDDIPEDVLSPLVKQATKEFHDALSAQCNRALSFQGYGSDFIKKAGHSPDAFVQVAMQLATYRLFREQVGTYEATQVRSFLHGRTETTRAVSIESEAFVKAMGLRPKKDHGDPVQRKVKLDLLKKATTAHAEYTSMAAQALGVDRHFFGLSLLVQEGEAKPALFSDPVFVRSKTWRTSTSHLTHPNFLNWGFGQVVEDGVGIGYSIHPQSCIFNITALAETQWTMKLSHLLEEALLEMQDIINQDLVDSTTRPQ